MAVAIYSMLKKASDLHHYDIIILTTDIKSDMEKKLRIMLKNFSNYTLRIWDITPYASGANFITHNNIGTNLVAACHGPDFVGEYKSIPSVKEYCENVLKMKNPLNYFHAGVMIFNVKEMRKVFNLGELVEYRLSKKFL